MKATRLAVALSFVVLFAVSGIALAQPFPGMPAPGQQGMAQPQNDNMPMNAQFGMPQQGPMMPGMGPGPMGPGMMPGMGPGQMMPGMMPGMGPGQMMPGAGGGTAIAVTDDFVFVVYNGALYQFTTDGLDLIKSVPLRPQGQRMRPQGGPDGAGPADGQQNRQLRQNRQQQKQVNPNNAGAEPVFE